MCIPHMTFPFLQTVGHVKTGSDWTIVSVTLAQGPAGIHDLIVALTDAGPVEIDWVRFE